METATKCQEIVSQCLSIVKCPAAFLETRQTRKLWTWLHRRLAEEEQDLEPYEYAPLQNDGTQTLRVLGLAPATDFNAPLLGELTEYPFEIAKHVYGALSYVWGSQENMQTLLCSSSLYDIHPGNWGKIPITQNLDTALRYLRDKDKVVYVWIDAVCINQNDQEEKQKQIALMAEIYYNARKCIIWVGEPDKEMRRALRFTWVLHRFGLHLAGPISMWCMRTPLLKHTRASINQLLNHPWFTRVWTLQELMLSRPAEAYLMIARTTMRFNHLYNLSFSTVQMVASTSRIQNFLSFFPMTAERAAMCPNGAFYRLLTDIKASHATEVKDKVIGTLAVLEKLGVRMPIADYEKSVQALFIEATLCWVKHFRNLSCLTFAVSSPHKTPGLPSWCIDWASSSKADEALARLDFTIAQHSYLHLGSDTDGYLPQATRNSPSPSNLPLRSALALPICARIIDHVSAHVNPFHKAFKNAFPLRGKENSWSWHWPDEIEFDGLIELAAATEVVRRWLIFLCSFPATVLAKFLVLVGIDPVPNQAWEGTELHVEQILRLSPRLLRYKAKEILLEALFVTDEGRVGTCFCEVMEEGDVVVLAAGSDYPLILRPRDSEEGRYSFVGPAIVYGMMQGEEWDEETDVQELDVLTLV